MNQYSSGTIDVVLSALANALRCRIILLKKRENDYYVQCNDQVINPTREIITPKFTIKLLWAREHYDALVEAPSFTGRYVLDFLEILNYLFLNKTLSLPDTCQMSVNLLIPSEIMKSLKKNIYVYRPRRKSSLIRNNSARCALRTILLSSLLIYFSQCKRT